MVPEIHSSRTLMVVAVLLLALPFVSSGALGAADAPAKEELLAHPEVRGALSVLDAWIEGTRIYDQVPGISAGVVVGQDLIWKQGYGYSNLETKRPADAETIYSICSISKLFTSIGVMQLRDAGELRLSDPVAEYLDWYDIEQAHPGSGPATIESLLTHSSGLPRESDFPYWNGPDFPFPTREELIERLDDQETLYPAQSNFQYSNLALTLAGEVVQAVSGVEYQDYVRANILEPLGLADTRPFYPEELRGEQLAIGYTGMHRDLQRDVVAPFFTRGITAAAGFTSTVEDLARFASWQFGLLDQEMPTETDVLAPNTLREMQRVHWTDPDFETTWGLGFSVRRVDDMTVVGHGGGCPGYITRFDLVPAKRVAAIMLTNAGDGPASRLASNALKLMTEAVAKAEKPVEEETPDFSRFEGNYQSPPWGGETAIRQWGDQLAVVDLPSRDLDDVTRLEHVEGDTFVRLTDDGEKRERWSFEIGKDGKAERIKLHGIYLTRIE